MRRSTKIILAVIAVLVLAGGAATYGVYSMFADLDCKAEAYSGKGIGRDDEEAKRAADQDWRRNVSKATGWDFSTSSIEINASTTCNQVNGGSWMCEKSARPCKM